MNTESNTCTAAPEIQIAVVEISKLSLKRGDALVVSMDGPVHVERADVIRENLGRILPEGVSIIVKSKDVEFSVVTPAAAPSVDTPAAPLL